MVGVFKRASGLSLGAQNPNTSINPLSFTNTSTGAGHSSVKELQITVEECLKCYTGLAVGSGFLEYEDEMGLGGNGIANVAGSFGRSGFGGNGFT